LKELCHACRYRVAVCQAFVVDYRRILRLISCIAHMVPKLWPDGFLPGFVYIELSDHDSDRKNDERAEESLQKLKK
jgi:hypothetical protein